MEELEKVYGGVERRVGGEWRMWQWVKVEVDGEAGSGWKRRGTCRWKESVVVCAGGCGGEGSDGGRGSGWKKRREWMEFDGKGVSGWWV